MGFGSPALGLRAVTLKSKHTAGAMLGSLGQTPGHAREMVGSSVLGDIFTPMGNCQLYGPIFGQSARIRLRIYLGHPRKDHGFDSYLDESGDTVHIRLALRVDFQDFLWPPRVIYPKPQTLLELYPVR